MEPGAIIIRLQILLGHYTPHSNSHRSLRFREEHRILLNAISKGDQNLSQIFLLFLQRLTSILQISIFLFCR